MDDLEFRRTIYADPHSQDPNLKQAIEDDASRQAFWNDVKGLDQKIKQAAKVDVPEGLAHSLILRQSISSHRKQKKRTRVHLALATSVAFTLGVSFTLFQQHNSVNLSEHALAHVYHEQEYALKVDENVSIQQVNAKLASMGGEFTADIGRVYYANFCDFEKIRSLHMVIEGEEGRVSVFLVPHTGSQTLDGQFKDQRFNGVGIDLGHASMVLVGEKGEAMEKLENKLSKKLNFI